MDSAEDDRLRFQRLAGGDIVGQPPLFSPDEELLFVLSGEIIKIFSATTGQLVRELRGLPEQLISMQLELKDPDTLVACTTAGNVQRWAWSTGTLQSTQKLKIPLEMDVLTFNLLNMYRHSQLACAFVTFTDKTQMVQWGVVDGDTGDMLRVPCTMTLKEGHVLVDVQANYFKNIVIAQGGQVYFINYTNWLWKKLDNAHKVPVTVVRIHPTEEMVATGDEVGKIFLWRQFMDHRTVHTSLYHWHHTYVTSIAFSPAGTTFYSSGLESVLVKWNVDRSEQRQYLPRMASVICHITVSQNNSMVAVSTADNGVQFVGNDFQLKNTLQEFTYIYDFKTEQPKFPVGLHYNPRTNTLALNGRTGHLQFYSSYTRSFLYNLDIVQQNKLSMETGKILYDIQVTTAAFNIDWMATGEVYNDEERLPELRLKFWIYDEEKQSYALNTNIETPHEDGFRALAFSNDNQVDNLLCASVGVDNVIRMWALNDTDSVYRKGKVWICIARTSYKDMSIESISFSQDGSLLAAGYGNTLCIFKADTLKLKTALATSPALDGGAARQAAIQLPKSASAAVNGSRNEQAEERKKILLMFAKWLESGEKALTEDIKRHLQKTPKKGASQQSVVLQPQAFDEKHTALLYQKIMRTSELNLWQKILLFQQLGIQVKVHPQSKSRMLAYLADTANSALQRKEAKLDEELHRLSHRERFKAKYRMYRHKNNRRKYDTEVAANLTDILSVLNLNETTQQSQLNKSNSSTPSANNGTPARNSAADLANGESKQNSAPLLLAQIKHVQFAAGEHAHLIIACTETRVLVWNLLTLRLQSVLKLSVQHLAFDSLNNLVAVVTKSNELHIFQPNVPMPIYQRTDVPNLYGLIWMPRRHMKQRSINVDWQAHSTLYFFTENQEIMFLGSTIMAEVDEPPYITLPESELPKTWRYTTFGTYATKQHSEMKANNNNSQTPQLNGPLIIGKEGREAIETFVGMTNYTMPPLSLMCVDLMKSLLRPADEMPAEDETPKKVAMNGMNGLNGHNAHSDDSDSDDEDMNEATSWKAIAAKRRAFREQATASLKTKAGNGGELPNALETKMQRIIALDFDIDL